MMKVMVDASVCSKGGGVQVALALIKNIILDSEFEIVFVASPQIDSQLTEDQKSRLNIITSKLMKIFLGNGGKVKGFWKLKKYIALI